MKVKICSGIGEANRFLETTAIIKKTNVIYDDSMGLMIIYHYT